MANKGRPTSGSAKKVGAVVTSAAVALLQDERVRQQLANAAISVQTWFKNWRDKSARSQNPLGTKNILQRIERLEASVVRLERDVPELSGALRSDLTELRQAVDIARSVPLSKRPQLLRKVSRRLGEIEDALIEAVLPGEDRA